MTTLRSEAMRGRALRGALVIAGLLASKLASADGCPIPEGATLALARAAPQRIAFLRQNLDAQGRYAARWKWWWVGIGTATFASSVAQAAGWAAGDDVRRTANVIDNLIVSAFSVATPVAALALALRVESDAPVVDALLDQTDRGAGMACLVLARVEELFRKGAEEEAFDTSWLAHVTGVLGVGAKVGILAGEAAAASSASNRNAHWDNAIGNGLGGLVLTEAQILSQPTGAVTAYRRYLRGDLQGGSGSAPSFQVIPTGSGTSITLRWSF
jgi:hypothetical protein